MLLICDGRYKMIRGFYIAGFETEIWEENYSNNDKTEHKHNVRERG